MEQEPLRGAQLPQWTGDEASYIAVHHRLRRYRGRAAEHDCTLCGQEAHHWAYNNNGGPSEREAPNRRHGRLYSVDLADYDPMCRSCHRNFDADHNGQGQCGTTGGYYRHRRRGEQTCQPCRDAQAAYVRARNANKAARLTDPTDLKDAS